MLVKHHTTTNKMMRSSVISSDHDQILTPLELNFGVMDLAPSSTFNTTYTPRRVQAAERLEANTCSKPFYFDMFRLMSILYNQNIQQQQQPNSPSARKTKPLKVKCVDSQLHCDGDPFGWTYRVRLAANCFEQNLTAIPVEFNWDKLAQFNSSSPPVARQIRIALRTIRPIGPCEELCFWPSFELNLTLDIPFLAPSNIISGTCYICTTCGKCFTQPNPLKIHLKFICSLSNQLTSSAASATSDSTQSLSSPKSSHFTQSVSSIPSQTEKLYRSHHHQTSNQFFSSSSVKSSLKHSNKVSKSCKSSLFDEAGGHRKLHNCSYCGKVYTRKYGLKIHIRTHTGLKPLSCRFCGRSFSDPSNLNKHVRLHTQQQGQHQHQSSNDKF